MKLLGDARLPDGAAWIDKHTADPIKPIMVRAPGALVCALRQPAGIPVTLEILECDAVWLDRRTACALDAMAAKIHETWPMIWQNWHGTVIFRRDASSPVSLFEIPSRKGLRFAGIIRLLAI